VGVSIAAERPEAQVDLVESSEAAAAAAGKNAGNHAPGRTRVWRGDLYAALPERLRYRAITANPPYVASAEGRQLAPEILDHEPHQALFGGEDGLEVVRRVIAGVPEWLSPGGVFATEIDPSQGARVVELCKAAGLQGVRVERDLAGLDRHVVGRF
jgi:HemK-like putative methylase